MIRERIDFQALREIVWAILFIAARRQPTQVQSVLILDSRQRMRGTQCRGGEGAASKELIRRKRVISSSKPRAPAA
jgi:hypothetical protein